MTSGDRLMRSRRLISTLAHTSMRQHMLARRFVAVAVAVAVVPTPADASVRAVGSLTQFAGRKACLAPAWEKLPCTRIRGAAIGGFETSGVLSADARHLYVGGAAGIFAFRRAADGALVQLHGRSGCLVPHARHVCDRVRGLPGGSGGSSALAVSSDGRNVYLMADTQPWVLITFRRDPGSGRLEQLDGARGCITPASKGSCGHIDSPNAYAYELTASPDGRSVYLSTAGRVLVFARDVSTGTLRPAPGRAACVNRGGRHGCTPARADFQPGQRVDVSPDSTRAYIGPDVFARDAGTGALTELLGTATCPFDPDRAPACLPELLNAAIAWRRSPDG